MKLKSFDMVTNKIASYREIIEQRREQMACNYYKELKNKYNFDNTYDDELKNALKILTSRWLDYSKISDRLKDNFEFCEFTINEGFSFFYDCSDRLKNNIELLRLFKPFILKDLDNMHGFSNELEAKDMLRKLEILEIEEELEEFIPVNTSVCKVVKF